jgi:hypothetical protein
MVSAITTVLTLQRTEAVAQNARKANGAVAVFVGVAFIGWGTDSSIRALIVVVAGISACLIIG